MRSTRIATLTGGAVLGFGLIAVGIHAASADQSQLPGPLDVNKSAAGPHLTPDLKTCPRSDQRGEIIIDDFATTPDLKHLSPVQAGNAYLTQADPWTKAHADSSKTTAAPDPTSPLTRQHVSIFNKDGQLIALQVAYNEGIAGWHILRSYECD
jgi:hypothetical protein